jgi:hypothetical protein
MKRRIDAGPSPTPAARRPLPLAFRRAAPWLLVAAAALALPGTAAAATAVDTQVFTLRGALQQRPGFWGGPQTTAAGETVTVFASAAYPQDPARTLGWAEYLGGLVHGAELASVELYVAPLADVQRVCGSGALACYSAQDGIMFAPGDPPTPETSAEAIVAHEYGHHIAANRDNAPWPAIDWGTKRWATYLDVCGRTYTGVFHPGNERGYYRRNPGEGFAEAYRVLNEQRLGATPLGWTLVDQLLYPDDQALALLAQDVEQPWTVPTTSTVTGRVTAKTPRTTRIATPLDGTVRVTLRVPARSRLTLQLVDPETGSVLADGARGTGATPSSVTVQAAACGQRELVARVRAVKGGGAFRLAVTRP